MTDKSPGAISDEDSGAGTPNKIVAGLCELSTSRAARSLVKMIREDDYQKATIALFDLGKFGPAVTAEVAIILDRMEPRRSRQFLTFLSFEALIRPAEPKATKAFDKLLQEPEFIPPPVGAVRKD